MDKTNLLMDRKMVGIIFFGLIIMVVMVILLIIRGCSEVKCSSCFVVGLMLLKL
jgi:LSD1 subclass zinc finger protein